MLIVLWHTMSNVIIHKDKSIVVTIQHCKVLLFKHWDIICEMFMVYYPVTTFSGSVIVIGDSCFSVLKAFSIFSRDVVLCFLKQSTLKKVKCKAHFSCSCSPCVRHQLLTLLLPWMLSCVWSRWLCSAWMLSCVWSSWLCSAWMGHRCYIQQAFFLLSQP